MSKTASNIVDRALTLIDEQVVEFLEAASTEMSVREMALEILPEVCRDLIKKLPYELKKYLATEYIARDVFIDNDSYFKQAVSFGLPSDFWELVSAKLSVWSREVTNYISVDNPEYSRQNNPFTRNGKHNPAIALVSNGNVSNVGFDFYVPASVNLKNYAELLEGTDYAFDESRGYWSSESASTEFAYYVWSDDQEWVVDQSSKSTAQYSRVACDIIDAGYELYDIVKLNKISYIVVSIGVGTVTVLSISDEATFTYLQSISNASTYDYNYVGNVQMFSINNGDEIDVEYFLYVSFNNIPDDSGNEWADELFDETTKALATELNVIKGRLQQAQINGEQSLNAITQHT